MFLEKFSLQGLVGIVTGSGQGIGRVYCHALAEAGADLVVAEKNVTTGEQTARLLDAAGNQSLFVETDVRRPADVERMVEKTLQTFGRIDFLINNAAVSQACSTVDVSEQEWRSIFDVNLNGTFFCCQAVGRHMIERRAGSIVNISSISGLIGNQGRAHLAYNVSKAGVAHLTRVLSCEWARHNVRVNGIIPGFVATEQAKRALADPDYGVRIMPRIPMQRLADPEELGPLAIFLVSSASSYITGANVVIDGGYTCW